MSKKRRENSLKQANSCHYAYLPLIASLYKNPLSKVIHFRVELSHRRELPWHNLEREWPSHLPTVPWTTRKTTNQREPKQSHPHFSLLLVWGRRKWCTYLRCSNSTEQKQKKRKRSNYVALGNFLPKHTPLFLV